MVTSTDVGTRGPAGGRARNMLSLTAANVLTPLAAVVTAPVLAQTLGVVGRGEVAAATAPYLLVTAVAAFGVPEAVTYFVARQQISARQAMRRSSKIVLGSAALASAVLLLASDWLSNGDDAVQTLIVLSAVAALPALVVGVLRGAAAGLQRWSLVVWERMLVAAARLVAIPVLAVTGHLTVTSATVVIVFSPLLGALSYLALRDAVGDESEDGMDGGSTAGEVLSFGMRVWIGSVSGILLMRFDQAVIAPLSEAAELGLYVVAASISEVPLIFTRAMRDVTFAADAASESDDRLALTARLCGLAALLVGGVIAVTLPLWIRPVFGDEFSDALPVAWLLIAAVVLGAPGSIAGAGLSARGRPGLRSAGLVLAFSVHAILLLLLVPPYGAIGAAIATLIGNAVANGFVVALMRCSFGVAPQAFYGVHRGDLRLLGRAISRIAPHRLMRSGS